MLKSLWFYSPTLQTNADFGGRQKKQKNKLAKTRRDIKLKQSIAGISLSKSDQEMDTWWWMTHRCINKMDERIKKDGCVAELSYPWRRAGHGACTSHPGGAPGESGWSFSPAGAPGIPWSEETGRGRGGGGRTRRRGGKEGAVRRKRSEGVGDLEDGGREKEGGRRREGGGVRQNRWQWLTVIRGPVLKQVHWDVQITQGWFNKMSVAMRIDRLYFNYLFLEISASVEEKKKPQFISFYWNYFLLDKLVSLKSVDSLLSGASWVTRTLFL